MNEDRTLPRYGTPGGPLTWCWTVNEDMDDECLVYADTAYEVLGAGHPLPAKIWSIRCMGDNE